MKLTELVKKQCEFSNFSPLGFSRHLKKLSNDGFCHYVSVLLFDNSEGYILGFKLFVVIFSK